MSALGQELRFNQHIEKVRAVTHPHTHTQRCTQNQKCISTYSYTQTHMVRKSACQNSEPCQIRRSLCTLCPSSLERDCLKHTCTHTHTTFGQLPKFPGAGSFAWSYFLPSFHTQTHTQTGSLVYKVVLVCLWIVIGRCVAIQKKKFFFPV